MKDHHEIDWEYEAEKLACKFLSLKYNHFNYLTTRDICEDEMLEYLVDNTIKMKSVIKRIKYRIKNGIEYLPAWKRDEMINFVK